MLYLGKHITIWLSLLVSLLKPGGDQQFFKLRGYAQGTTYQVSYFAARPVVQQREVDSILLRIDSSMSLYKSYSLINRFNASAGGLEIDDYFKMVINKSFEIYQRTKGKFDITVAPLVQLWGFGPLAITKFPEQAVIQQTLVNVGMDLIQLKGNQLIKKKPGVQIDLNGIAQGYSVDEVAHYLTSKGITSFMVEIGGEIVVKGTKPDGSLYKIGIEGPPANGKGPALRKIISINQGAITTSGNYIKYLQQKGNRVSHLINPKTGYPLSNQMISVTLYAKDAITADGYDNAVMAMEVNEALRFINRKKDMEAYLVYRKPDGSVADTLTNGFRQLLKD